MMVKDLMISVLMILITQSIQTYGVWALSYMV